MSINNSLYKNCIKKCCQTKVKDIITEKECGYLVDSIKVMALDTAIKNLTNHVNGNIERDVEYKTQNLDRCKNQLKIVEELERNYDLIKMTIEDVVLEMLRS